MTQEAYRIIGELEVAKLHLGPGDVLVVRVVDQKIEHHVAERLRETMKSILPPDVKCMVIDESINLEVLTAEQIAEKTAA